MSAGFGAQPLMAARQQTFASREKRKMSKLVNASLVIGALAAAIFSNPALAQQSGTPLLAITTPVVNLVDENHVSLASGKLELSLPLLKFGDVEFEVHAVNGYLWQSHLADNNSGKIIACGGVPNLGSSTTVYAETSECSATSPSITFQAVYGEQRSSFDFSSGVWVPESANGETLTGPTNGYCTWTRRDGTQIIYYDTTGSNGPSCESQNIAKIIYPDGRVADYYYYGAISSAPSTSGNPILSISTSDGYLLQYNYSGTPVVNAETSVTAINRAFQACDPTVSCNTTGWPTATLGWTNKPISPPEYYFNDPSYNGSYHYVLTATSSKQEKYVMEMDSIWRVISYQPPGATQPKYTYTLCTQYPPTGYVYSLQNCFGYTSWDFSAPEEQNQVQQYFIDEVQDITREGVHGGHAPETDLNFSYPAWVRYYHRVTNPSGTTEALEGNQSPNMWNAAGYGGPIMYFTDKDGTNYTFGQGVANRLQSVSTSGIVTSYGYDNWGDVTSETITPNSGTGTITHSAIYPGNCTASTMVTCTKPTSVTDGNNKTTYFTYDPTHGGVLTETDPAVNGITPQKRYTYVQRYPWYLNSAGNMTRETRPVWLLNTESYCRTSAPAASGTGCTAANDEVVTTYDYGPDSGPNNLLIRGQTVTSAGVTRRSCDGHDKYGNKIWEQAPNANASSCPAY